MSDRYEDQLISEFSIVRNDLKKMVQDLEKVSINIDKLFPSKFDIRYKRVFEEKIHTTTELYKTILSLRQEIGKSLKTEIELRRKDKVDDGEFNLDIRALLKLVECKSNEINKEEKI